MAINRRLYLQLLAHFDALVTEKHVTRAAEKMGIGQPAMSGALSRLREMFNDPILVRTGSGMEPTERALLLAQQINEAMRLIEDAVSHDGSVDLQEADGHYRVLASEGIAHLLLPQLMRLVRAKAPNIQLSFSPGDIRVLNNVLRDGDADLGIGFVRNPPDSLYHTVLYHQRLVCIASIDHPKIQGTISLDELLAFPHVVWGGPPVPYPTMEVLIDELLAERQVSRKVGLRIPTFLLAPEIVATTDMLAILPERVARPHEGKSLQVFQLPFNVGSIDICLYWHERRHRDPVHAWLRSAIKQVAPELGEY
ncbi:LysR family transcriptional regulator [Paraburkholderia tropica]|jgi:LysR family transcriptional regulator, mexEF-oprN operon transcriptional activator|uniref:LysR family transcriptional regulator n=1 Tax=Paraburkholderia tropica TaxID=92647 RepID=UPI002ABD8DAF|nr:LysR family transcriptional regulator [Paraburkholderia tropica]